MGVRTPAILLACALSLQAQSWPTFFSAYEDGLTAQSQANHALASQAFNRAIALNPRPGIRVKTYGMNFLPTYFPYLRLAESRLALGDLGGAEAALRLSANLALEPPADREALSVRLRGLRDATAEKQKPSPEKAPEPQKLAPPVAPVQVPVSAPAPVLPSPWLQTTLPTKALPADETQKAASRKPADTAPAVLPTATAKGSGQPDGNAVPEPSGKVAVPIAVEGPPGPSSRPARWRWLWWLPAGGIALGAVQWRSRRRKPSATSSSPTVLHLDPGHPTGPWTLNLTSEPGVSSDANIGRAFGPYLATRLLGQGGCATAYFGVHRESGLEVAIKVPHPHLLRDGEFKARFHREASLGSLLEHRKIVPILDPGPTEGDPWLAMKYIQGCTLDVHLAERMTLGIDEAIRIGADVAEAIAFAHSKGVVHRDLKPGNIMITPEGAIVMDFGIARVLDVSMTVNTMFIGTPLYSAPECVITPRVGPAADRYALGIILFEMLGGRTPFSGESPFQILECQRSQPLPDLLALRPLVPQRLNRLIQRLCAKAPEDRPEDGEMVAILEELLGAHASKD